MSWFGTRGVGQASYSCCAFLNAASLFKHNVANYILESTSRHGFHDTSLIDLGLSYSHTKSSKMKIGTHNGFFHSDEALAIYMLKRLPEYKDAEVIRTRDPTILDSCDIVVDVGGVYDPSTNRYDHHQREFDVYFDDNHTVTKLSSAGLVYKHFAKRIFREVYGVKDDEIAEYVYQTVYDRFIESVDAIDNGVPISDGVLKYKWNTDLGSRVGRLNPSWIDVDVNSDERFVRAIEVAGQDFEHFVTNILNVTLPAKACFEEAFARRYETHASGRIIEMVKSCPFSDFLYKYESDNDVPKDERILFYMSHDKAANNWRATAVKEKDSQFTSRMPFPKRLRGLRDKELEAESGIPDLVFVHATGFTCAGKTKESVLKLFDLALEECRGS